MYERRKKRGVVEVIFRRQIALAGSVPNNDEKRKRIKKNSKVTYKYISKVVDNEGKSGRKMRDRRNTK